MTTSAMRTETSSSSSRHNTTQNTNTADTRTTANGNAGRPAPKPGPEMVAQALPFETIPAAPFRDHFTEWLHQALGTADGRRDAPADRALPTNPAAAHPAAQSGTPSEPAIAAHTPEADAATCIREAGAANEPTAPQSRPPAASRPEPAASRPRSRPAPRKTGRSRPAGPPPPASPPEPAAPQRRPQFVRFGDKSVWLTKPMLRSRGWTEASIRDRLPEPEGLKPNPRFAVSGAPMSVWKPETVAAAEADPEWRTWLERSLRRRNTTLEALAATDDRDFQSRLETADKAIKAWSPPPAALVEPADPPTEEDRPTEYPETGTRGAAES